MSRGKNQSRLGDPQEVYEDHRERLKQHAASDNQSAWLAEALLGHVADTENAEDDQ